MMGYWGVPGYRLVNNPHLSVQLLESLYTVDAPLHIEIKHRMQVVCMQCEHSLTVMPGLHKEPLRHILNLY